MGSSGGDSIFSSVTQDSDYVYFILADGTVLTVQKKAGSGLNIEFSVEQGVAIMPDVVSKFSYTVTGGDQNTLVRASFGGTLAEDGAVIVKPVSASAGEIHVFYETWYDSDEREEPFDDDDYGFDEDLTVGDFIDSNLFIFVSVTDGKGNSILKSLNFTEGILSSVSEAYEIEASAGTVTVQVKTNLDYGYEVFVPKDAFWLSYVPTKAGIRTEELAFKVAENAGSLSRSAVVELRNEKGMAMEEFTIVQKSPISDKAITFADAVVKAACVAKFDKNGDGVLTYGEVSTVTDVSGLFDEQAKSKITSFDEFEYFVSVTKLPSNFLSGAQKLTSIKLPENLTTIGQRAFQGSALQGTAISGTDLVALEIPANVTSISYYAFEGCPYLTAVKMNPTAVPKGGNGMFPTGTVVYVPEESVEAYKAADFWSDYVILSDKMMTLSLSMEYSIASEITYLREDNSFNVPVTFKLSSKESDMSSVKEYGLSIQAGYGYQLRIPVNGLNKEHTEELKFETRLFNENYETYAAVADVEISAYILLNDDSMLTFDKSAAQIKYDTKPSVTFSGYDVAELNVTSSRSRAEIDFKMSVEGSFWINRLGVESEGDGDLSSSTTRLADGENTYRGIWTLISTDSSSSKITVKFYYLTDAGKQYIEPITLSYSEIFK